MKRRRSGFILTAMAVCTAVVMACAGLAIDAGYLQLIKTQMQTAADAAALGGAQEIKANGSANAVTAARNDAAANGFTNGQHSATVTVNNPPSTGYSTGDSTAVEVLISQSVAPVFMELLGFSSTKVSVRSVAHQGAGGSSCLFTLDPSASSAFSISNGVGLVVHCGVQVNSSSATALTVTGGSSLTATSIGVVGNYTVNGGSTISPAPTTHAAAASDPLASLQPPAVGACNHTNFSVTSGSPTLSQGVYCGGISISNGVHVTFNPGTYILEGGGLTVAGGSTVTGSGLMFYNTAGSGYAYGGINLNNGCSVTFSAPTTSSGGAIAGILFFQDRTIVGGAASSFTGGASAVLNGTLYFPTTTLTYSGGSGTSYTILVSDEISFSGGATVNSNYSSLPGGSPIKGSIGLSE
jgi:hypothetical protein